MRTTVDIPDAKYRLLKSKAAMRGKSIKQLVLRGVDVVLREEERGPLRRKLKLPLIAAKNPGSLDIDNERIYDLIGFP
jgi:hypothetical protein